MIKNLLHVAVVIILVLGLAVPINTVEAENVNSVINPMPDRAVPNDQTTTNLLSIAATHVSAGYEHTCALTTSGGVKCWGTYSGDGLSTGRSTPVDVVGLSNGVNAISAGGGVHTCALTTYGGVKCWGNNDNGELGDGTTTNRYIPVDVIGLTSGVSAISAGLEYTCAITTSRGVKCWGDNYYGQLGDGTTTSHSTPVDLIGLSNGVSAISSGTWHTCALTISGGVKCWGNNNGGWLGDGTTTDRYTPVDVVGLTSGVIAISVGNVHSCALTSSGGVKCWGKNFYGELGDGTTTNRYTPVDVVGLTEGVSAISAEENTSCALTTSGGVKCWGQNGNGQLGDGTTNDRFTPVDVVGLTDGVNAISAGGEHTCALTSTSGVKCWGWNGWGQLGDGTFTERHTPVDVVGFGGDYYILSGRVNDENGNSLANVKIQVVGPTTVSTTTNVTGNYTVTGLAAGEYTITASSSYRLFGPESRIVSIPGNSDSIDFTGFSCTAPTGLNICALEPGDVLLKVSDPDFPDNVVDVIIHIGGSYFTHAAIYVGVQQDPTNHDFWRPAIVEATSPGIDENEVWETSIIKSSFWLGTDVVDWSVVRPNVDQSSREEAIVYAREKAKEVGVTYWICDDDPLCLKGLHPLVLTSETKFYCSGLVWKAYQHAGVDIKKRVGFSQYLTNGWVLPDDLYFGSPQVDTKPGMSRLIARIYSPAHLTLIDGVGRRTGYDPDTGNFLNEIPETLYTGTDTQIETIYINYTGDTTDWKLVLTGFNDGDYHLETGHIRHNAFLVLEPGTISAGEVIQYPVKSQWPTFFLPFITK